MLSTAHVAASGVHERVDPHPHSPSEDGDADQCQTGVGSSNATDRLDILNHQTDDEKGPDLPDESQTKCRTSEMRFRRVGLERTCSLSR